MPDTNTDAPQAQAAQQTQSVRPPHPPDTLELVGLTRAQVAAALRAEQERGWAEGQPPQLEDYRDLLTQIGAGEDTWVELICNEVFLRERHGERPEAAEYLRRFPALADRILDQFRLLGMPVTERPPAPQTAVDVAPHSSSVALFDPPSPSGTAAIRPAINRATPTDKIPLPPPSVAAPPAAPLSPEVVAIPGYEILGELGRGGMGVVYKARQKGLNRLVALKMILSKKRGIEDLHARFMREAESVARLRHPNIVQVYEIGEYQEQPFLSLEFVDGGTLDQHIDGRPQAPEFAANIVEQIARAVHHAHEHGVVHRDLKPSNILLTAFGTAPPVATEGRSPSPGPGLREPVPKITDFGLAKQLDNQNHLTATHAVAGTPAYMAPEQVYAGKKHEVGPRADVWALGVILYEMLTGHAPFLADTPLEVMRLVAHGEPVPPSRSQPRTPRDLETICLRCLQKDPNKRYPTARDLADDLRSFLEQKPIVARPVGTLEQAWGWCKRNPVVASLLTTIGVTLTAGAGVATFFAIRAADQAAKAEEKSAEAFRSAADANKAREEEARLNRQALLRAERHGREQYADRMYKVRREWEAGRVASARKLLASFGTDRHGGPDPRGFEWYYLERLCRLDTVRFETPAGAPLAVSADGKRVAWADGDAAQVWDVAGHRRVWFLRGHGGPVRCVAFDPTGARAATAAADGTVRLWEAHTGAFLYALSGPKYAPTGLSFSPDGKRLARVGSTDEANDSRGELHVWEVRSGDLVAAPTLPLPALRGVGFGQGGKWLAAVGREGSVHVWDAAGEAVTTLAVRGQTPVSITCTPKGGFLACGTAEGRVVIWEAPAWREICRLPRQEGAVTALAFSADELKLASAGEDAVIRLWDVPCGELCRQFPGHTGSIEVLAFSRAGSGLFSSSRDGTVRGWDAARDPEYWSMPQAGPAAGLHALAGGRFAAVNAAGECLVGDIAVRRPTPFSLATDGARSAVVDSALTADGGALVLCRADNQLFRCTVGEKRSAPLNLSRLRPKVQRVVCAPDGERLASVHADGTVQIHRFDDTVNPAEVRLEGTAITAVAFHPRAPSRLALGTANGTVVLWDLTSLRAVFKVRGHQAAVSSVAFSPDGKLFASGSDDGMAKLWDGTGTEEGGPERRTLEGHTAAVRQVAFCPSGDRVVTGSDDRSTKVWDVESGQETLTLPAHARAVVGVIFARDGRTLLTRGADGEVRAWEAGP